MHENKKQKNRGKITKEYKRTRSELGLSLKHSYDFLLCFSCPHFISGNAKVLHWFIYRCRSLFTLKIIKAIQFDWCCCCLRLQPVFFLFVYTFLCRTNSLSGFACAFCGFECVSSMNLSCSFLLWQTTLFVRTGTCFSASHIYISGVSITFNCEC